jgi:hypothetical protein
MKAMMHDHLRLTTDEVVAGLQHKWAADVRAYDRIHLQILRMSDMHAESLCSSQLASGSTSPEMATRGKRQSPQGAPRAGNETAGVIHFLSSGLDEPAPDGIARELDSVAHPELAKDVLSMPLDRLDAYEKLARDLLRAVGLGDEFQHL